MQLQKVFLYKVVSTVLSTCVRQRCVIDYKRLYSTCNWLEISLFQNCTNCHILDLFPRVIVIWWAVMVVKACKTPVMDSGVVMYLLLQNVLVFLEPEICGTVTKVENNFFFFFKVSIWRTMWSMWTMSRTCYIGNLSIVGEWCSSKNLYVWVNLYVLFEWT